MLGRQNEQNPTQKQRALTMSVSYFQSCVGIAVNSDFVWEP